MFLQVVREEQEVRKVATPARNNSTPTANTKTDAKKEEVVKKVEKPAEKGMFSKC